MSALPSISPGTPPAAPRLYYGWVVAALTFVILLVGAGVRATPSILINPLEHEFGWSVATISGAVAVNIFLYGLIGPFAVALMERFGLRVAKADEVDLAQVVVHDAGDHELAFALSRLSDQDLTHTVTGIFRSVERSTYDDAARAQVQQAVETARTRGAIDLQAMLNGRDTWTVVG